METGTNMPSTDQVDPVSDLKGTDLGNVVGRDRFGTPCLEGWQDPDALKVGFQSMRGESSSARSPRDLGLLSDRRALCLCTQAASRMEEQISQGCGYWVRPCHPPAVTGGN